MSGELSPESLEMVEQLLQAGQYYQQQETKKQQNEKENRSQIDGIILCFMGTVFCGLVFLSSVVASNLSNFFYQHSVNSTQTK